MNWMNVSLFIFQVSISWKLICIYVLAKLCTQLHIHLLYSAKN
jgi:hypothetical protein